MTMMMMIVIMLVSITKVMMIDNNDIDHTHDG